MMHYSMTALFAVLLLVVDSSSLPSNHWAVLVAGSSGYSNYRHQADLCHAYNVLHAKGVPEVSTAVQPLLCQWTRGTTCLAVDSEVPLQDHIITMIFDDIAQHPSNPFPGQIFNQPSQGLGIDVYRGCKRSYTGAGVTAHNFLAVLRGDVNATEGGSGEVLRSDADSEVFVAYFDHGATFMLGMPSAPYVYADDLLAAFQFMQQHGMYHKLTVYVEACESGSMFDSLLPANASIYATTASSPYESSWATFCAPDDTVNGTDLHTCLADLYAYNWIEDATSSTHDNSTTLQEQYENVRAETTLSHVMQYGDPSVLRWPSLTFEGSVPPPSNTTTKPDSASGLRPRGETLTVETKQRVIHDGIESTGAGKHHVSARLAAVYSLQRRLESAVPGTDMHAALSAEFDGMRQQTALHRAAFTVLASEHLRGLTLMQAISSTVGTLRTDQWACYKAGNLAMSYHCGQYTDESMQFSRVLALVCELHSPNFHADEVVRTACDLAKAQIAT